MTNKTALRIAQGIRFLMKEGYHDYTQKQLSKSINISIATLKRNGSMIEAIKTAIILNEPFSLVPIAPAWEWIYT